VFEQARQPALLGLFAYRVRHLVLEIRVSVDCVPPRCHEMRSGSLIFLIDAIHTPKTKLTAIRINCSASKKKTEAIATITNTMIVVTVVSLRVGHVTFCASARTSCKNLNGLTFAITRSSVFPAQFLRT